MSELSGVDSSIPETEGMWGGALVSLGLDKVWLTWVPKLSEEQQMTLKYIEKCLTEKIVEFNYLLIDVDYI